MQLSGMVCDHFAESSSHHLQSVSNPLYLFLSHVQYMYVHRSTHSTGLREPKTNSVKLQIMQVAASPCHLFTSQLFIISSQVCRYKTNGTPGKCQFPCPKLCHLVNNLARVTFSQISVFRCFQAYLNLVKLLNYAQNAK